MKNSGDKLKKLRQSLGLSIAEMGQRIGVSAQSIGNYEKGISQKRPHSLSAKVINDFLTGNPKSNNLQLNHCYIIREENHQDGVYRKGERSSVDKPFVFRYENKQGIHHCFKEVRGGWSRTYTDQQLIGKIIEEVN